METSASPTSNCRTRCINPTGKRLMMDLSGMANVAEEAEAAAKAGFTPVRGVKPGATVSNDGVGVRCSLVVSTVVSTRFPKSFLRVLNIKPGFGFLTMLSYFFATSHPPEHQRHKPIKPCAHAPLRFFPAQAS